MSFVTQLRNNPYIDTATLEGDGAYNNPLRVVGGGSGGGGSQAFRYFATGAEGTQFTITLATPRADAVYVAQVTNGAVAALLVFSCPSSGYTATDFECITSAPPTAGDELLITVEDRS